MLDLSVDLVRIEVPDLYPSGRFKIMQTPQRRQSIMRHGKAPRGHRHPVETDQFLYDIKVFSRLQDGIAVGLDDVLHLGVLEQVTSPLGGTAGAVSGLYGCGTAITATGDVRVGEACLFFVEWHR